MNVKSEELATALLSNTLNPKHLERPKQAARHFKIGVSTYWYWVATRPGFPKPIKAGRGVTLVDINATEAYIFAQSGAVK